MNGTIVQVFTFFSIEKLNEKEILLQKYRKRERRRDRSLAVI